MYLQTAPHHSTDGRRATHLILPLIRTALRHAAAVTGAEGSSACLTSRRKEVVASLGTRILVGGFNTPEKYESQFG